MITKITKRQLREEIRKMIEEEISRVDFKHSSNVEDLMKALLRFRGVSNSPFIIKDIVTKRTTSPASIQIEDGNLVMWIV